MSNKSRFPATRMSDYERNARLYLHLTSLGLVTVPVFTKESTDSDGSIEDIDYIIVSCNRRSTSIIKSSTKHPSKDSVGFPMTNSKIARDSSTAQSHGDNVIYFPTKL